MIGRNEENIPWAKIESLHVLRFESLSSVHNERDYERSFAVWFR